MDEKEIKKMLEKSMTRLQNGDFDFSKDWWFFFFVLFSDWFNPKDNAIKDLGGISDE